MCLGDENTKGVLKGLPIVVDDRLASGLICFDLLTISVWVLSDYFVSIGQKASNVTCPPKRSPVIMLVNLDKKRGDKWPEKPTLRKRSSTS